MAPLLVLQVHSVSEEQSLSLSLSIHFSFRPDNAMQEVGNLVVSDNEKAIEVQLALF